MSPTLSSAEGVCPVDPAKRKAEQERLNNEERSARKRFKQRNRLHISIEKAIIMSELVFAEVLIKTRKRAQECAKGCKKRVCSKSCWGRGICDTSCRDVISQSCQKVCYKQHEKVVEGHRKLLLSKQINKKKHAETRRRDGEKWQKALAAKRKLENCPSIPENTQARQVALASTAAVPRHFQKIRYITTSSGEKVPWYSEHLFEFRENGPDKTAVLKLRFDSCTNSLAEIKDEKIKAMRQDTCSLLKQMHRDSQALCERPETTFAGSTGQR